MNLKYEVHRRGKFIQSCMSRDDAIDCRDRLLLATSVEDLFKNGSYRAVEVHTNGVVVEIR